MLANPKGANPNAVPPGPSGRPKKWPAEPPLKESLALGIYAIGHLRIRKIKRPIENRHCH
jgi:hypothetical protein